MPGDSWRQLDGGAAPSARHRHTAVWTGTEMIVWGGDGGAGDLNTGGIYNPAANSWVPMSTTGAPAARSDHSAVWTGSAMIVWGGVSSSGGNTLFNDGACYFPATNTWTPLNTSGAPAGRGSHTAVWTGSEMIVWGGTGTLTYNDGARYHPQTDTWTPVNAAGAPVDRFSHTAVWTGTRMIVWGGQNFDGYLDSGGSYDPGTNLWSAVSTAGAPLGRWLHSAVWTGSQMIVWGGHNGLAGDYLGDGGRYDPAANAWSAISTTGAPAARLSHTAVWTGSDMIVWGGTDGAALQNGRRYYPATNTWTALSSASAPAAREKHTAVWTGTRMIVWGGLAGAVKFNDAGRFDPAADVWDGGTASTPSVREGQTSVWTGSEMIIWGGEAYNTPTGHLLHNTGSRFNPATGLWRPTSTVGAPSGRIGHTAVWTGSEMIIWGGTADRSGGRYNPSTDTWSATKISGSPGGRSSHTAIWTGSGMIVWGGKSGNVATRDGAFYAPGTDTWTSLNSFGAPAARWAHTAVWTGSEMIVWGGQSAYIHDDIPENAFLNSGGRYNVASDAWSAMPDMPVRQPDVMDAMFGDYDSRSVRAFHTAVWTGSEMIIAGGSYTAYLAPHIPFDETTHLIDGGRFRPASNSWTPLAKVGRFTGHTAVWSGKEMLLFGGQEESSYFSIHRRFDPTANAWHATTSVNAPSARFRHSAVWTGSEMLVQGGVGGNKYLTDTWSYNPGNITPPVPFDIRSIVSNGGLLTITFDSETGKNYTLWSSDNMAAGTWTNTGLSALSGTGAALSFTLGAPAPPARRFFRVQSQMP